MKEKIITDFLNYDKSDNSPKKYLELPVFDNNYNLKKNIIFYKKWDNYSKKLEDKKKVLRLHDYFLGQLTTLFLKPLLKRYFASFFPQTNIFFIFLTSCTGYFAL